MGPKNPIQSTNKKRKAQDISTTSHPPSKTTNSTSTSTTAAQPAISLTNAAEIHKPAELGSKYAVKHVTVTANCKIEHKVRAVLSHLCPASLPEDSSHGEEFVSGEAKEKSGRPPLVVISAVGAAAGKAVSVVEIAKREVEKSGHVWFQYMGAGSKVEEIKGSKNESNGDEMDVDEEGEDEEPAFEPVKEKAKVKKVSVLTMWLATESIPELRKFCSEQTPSGKTISG